MSDQHSLTDQERNELAEEGAKSIARAWDKVVARYPEHGKLAAVPQEIRQQVGDWIESQHICDLVPTGTYVGMDEQTEYRPRRTTTSRLVAEVFGIDYAAFVEEKEAMVRELINGPTPEDLGKIPTDGVS